MSFTGLNVKFRLGEYRNLWQSYNIICRMVCGGCTICFISQYDLWYQCVRSLLPMREGDRLFWEEDVQGLDIRAGYSRCQHVSLLERHSAKLAEDIFRFYFIYLVLWRCWLGGRKGIRPVKTESWGAGVVICPEQGADLRMVYVLCLYMSFIFARFLFVCTFFVSICVLCFFVMGRQLRWANAFTGSLPL